jgi:hypothetical protein
MQKKSLLGLALLASTMTAANAHNDGLIDLLEKIRTQNIQPSDLSAEELETVVRYYHIIGIPMDQLTMNQESQESIVGKIVKKIIEEETVRRSTNVRCMSASNSYNPLWSVRCMIETLEDRAGNVRCIRVLEDNNLIDIQSIRAFGEIDLNNLNRMGGNVRCMKRIVEDKDDEDRNNSLIETIISK